MDCSHRYRKRKTLFSDKSPLESGIKSEVRPSDDRSDLDQKLKNDPLGNFERQFPMVAGLEVIFQIGLINVCCLFCYGIVVFLLK